MARCPACGASNGFAARFCDQCGRRIRSAGPAPLADRRVVTALFADLVDYVRMVAELDPEDVKQRVDAALATMGEAVQRYDGTIEKFIGDAVFAVFGHPRAHDDDALRAATCAAEIRDALARLPGPGGALQVRIGLATGEVVAAPRGPGGAGEVSLTGPAIVNAARLQDLARPGEILLDEATVAGARDRLDVADHGLELLRGHSEPIRLYALRLDAASLRPWGPPAGRLIGREAELARLREAIEETARTGLGRVVIVSGDAGLGKSRLIADAETDARAAGFAWTWAENVSYAVGEPYRFLRLFAQVVADEHGLDSGSFARQLLFTDDLPAAEAERLAGGIAAVARAASFAGWEAEATLAPTDPAEIFAAVLAVARRYIERLAEGFGPRVIVIDDVHWTDRSSLPMVDLVIESARRLPFVVLASSRSGARASWLRMDHVEAIELAPLAADETSELAADIAGAPIDPQDAARLHDRTGGNPLFIRELVRARLDVRDGRGPGVLELDPALETSPVPLTLRTLLGARIDALPPVSRHVLQIASVVGMTFTGSAIATIAHGAFDPTVLDDLGEAGLIIRTDGDDGWRFSHALIRDAAYAALLATQRRALHARLADALDRVHPRDVGRIGRHRAAAGDAARAVPCLVEAGTEAEGLGAWMEAAGYLEAAADLLSGGEAAALRARAGALRGRGGEASGLRAPADATPDEASASPPYPGPGVGTAPPSSDRRRASRRVTPTS